MSQPSSNVLKDRQLDWRASLQLDNGRDTAIFYGALTIIALSVFIPKLLPLTDYPQHLGLADIARRLGSPEAPEHKYFQVHLFTYNGLFHVVTAALGRFISVPLAGKCIVSFSLALQGIATLALVRTLQRPPLYAALFLPFLFSFSLSFGFVNFTLGMAVATTTLVFIARILRRPSWPSFRSLSFYEPAVVIVLGLVCAFTHVLAMILLCLFAASLAPETTYQATVGKSVRQRLWEMPARGLLAGGPLLAGCWYCIAVYRVQYAWNPKVYKDPAAEGTAPPIWHKIKDFAYWATGLHPDGSDRAVDYMVLSLALLLIVSGVWVHFSTKPRDAEPFAATAQQSGNNPLFLPFVALFSAYLVVPNIFIGTHFIFPRLAQPTMLALLLILPKPTAHLLSGVRAVALSLAVLGALNLTGHMIGFAVETNDAWRVIQDAPPGRRAASVIYEQDPASFRNRPLAHIAGYYGAMKAGDWAFNFARYQSVPVIFRAGGSPPWPARGWEFNPGDYNARCRFARYYDLLIVKGPTNTNEADVRKLVFRGDALFPRLLSQHGVYFLFDTQGLPDDGTW